MPGSEGNISEGILVILVCSISLFGIFTSIKWRNIKNKRARKLRH